MILDLEKRDDYQRPLLVQSPIVVRLASLVTNT